MKKLIIWVTVVLLWAYFIFIWKKTFSINTDNSIKESVNSTNSQLQVKEQRNIDDLDRFLLFNFGQNFCSESKNKNHTFITKTVLSGNSNDELFVQFKISNYEYISWSIIHCQDWWGNIMIKKHNQPPFYIITHQYDMISWWSDPIPGERLSQLIQKEQTHIPYHQILEQETKVFFEQ